MIIDKINYNSNSFAFRNTKMPIRKTQEFLHKKQELLSKTSVKDKIKNYAKLTLSYVVKFLDNF